MSKLDLEKPITKPLRAIRIKCLDCCCYDRKEVKLCATVNCPLWPFRFGKNPYRGKSTNSKMDEDTRKMLRALKESSEDDGEDE